MAKKKKTKKQKVISDYRKRMNAIKRTQARQKRVQEPTEKKPKPSSKPAKKETAKKEASFAMTPEMKQSRAYVIRDLRKTILISSAIFVIIIGLWWATDLQEWALSHIFSTLSQ